MNLSDTQKLEFVRGKAFHAMWTTMWRMHSAYCGAMHAATQMKRKQEMADRADWVYDAIDHAERIYDMGYGCNPYGGRK